MDNFECLTIQNISKMDINQDFAQKYLEYLVQLINLNKPIDFIQAALVMQTLSSVFAKKVDNLQEQILSFIIVFQKLENGKRSEDEAENADGQERGRAPKRKHEKEAFMRSFENICVPNNIRKSFIKKWSDKDIKKVDPYSIRNRINECSKLKTMDVYSCYIYDNKLDKLGRKEEFGVNGVLCNDLIPKDNFCLTCSHSHDNWKANDTVNMSAFPINVEQMESIAADLDDGPPSPIAAADASIHSYHDMVEDFLINSLNDKDDSISGHIYFEKINQIQERLVDVGGLYNLLWAPIENDNKLLDRKIRKRNVKSLPEEVKKKEKEDGVKYRAPDPAKYVLSDLMLALFKLKSDVPLYRHFMTGLQNEKQYRSKVVPKKNGKRAKTVTDFRSDGFRGFANIGDENTDRENLLDNELDLNDDDDDDDAVDNCMETAIQQIQQYQQGIYQNNQHEDTINEIAMKVSEWHDSIRPHLEREEKRTNFDIHEYGSQILNKYPTTNAKTTLDFSQCVENQPREEIPRFFLSSLLLANSYNIEISRDNPDELAVNDMKLSLLSRVRQHEVLDEGLRKELA